MPAISIFNLINEPFPDSLSFRQALLNTFGIALFICFFLYIFKPFGLHQVEEGLFGLCLAYGGVTFGIGLAFEFICHYVLKLKTDLPSWTLGKWICASVINICLIAVGNFLLAYALYPEHIYGWQRFFIFFGYTFSLGIIVISFWGLLIQLRAIKQNQSQAEAISMPLNKEAIENKKSDLPKAQFEVSKGHNFELDAASIIYIEAMQNYVVLNYLDAGQSKNQIIRSTIGGVADQLQNSSIVRCHRSYLVNVEMVEKVNGNAQGLRLMLKQLEGFEVPVSRTYIPSFKQALH